MAKNFKQAILYGQLEYQGIGVKNPYFLPGIIHIIAFLNEAACNSSTGELLRPNVEFFRVEMGIPFSLSSTTYDENPYASYMPSRWYKNLWRFISNPLFKLKITEDYKELLILCDKDEYLMQAFIAGGFKNAELKSLNFFRKFIQAVTLADIITADGNRISFKSYKGVESNGLHKDLMWPKVPTTKRNTSSIHHSIEKRSQQLFHQPILRY